MATDRGKQDTRVVRYGSPGVTPLEIWDFVLDEGILGDHVGAHGFGEALHETLTQLHAGQGRTRSGGTIPLCCRGFDAVVLTGGKADESLLGNRLSSASFTAACLGPDPFIGERGGYHILGGAGLSGAVVDVGQTQIKISLADHRFTYPREFAALPVRSGDEFGRVDRRAVESQRECLARYIGDSLKQACRATGFTPPALVVALPCEVDDFAVPGGSSYLGTDSAVNLIPRALHLAGLDDCEAMVLNDAELAALSVAVSSAKIVGERLLIITIGFGVGAALLDLRIWKK